MPQRRDHSTWYHTCADRASPVGSTSANGARAQQACLSQYLPKDNKASPVHVSISHRSESKFRASTRRSPHYSGTKQRGLVVSGMHAGNRDRDRHDRDNSAIERTRRLAVIQQDRPP
eukprot:3176062-Pyramimonas_sp.AAC.1